MSNLRIYQPDDGSMDLFDDRHARDPVTARLENYLLVVACLLELGLNLHLESIADRSFRTINSLLASQGGCHLFLVHDTFSF